MCSKCVVLLGVCCAAVVIALGWGWLLTEVYVPHPGASFWIPSALFCDAGIRRVCCRRCRFVLPPSSCLDQVRRCVKGMGDRPRFRGFRPAPCKWGTTERCVPREVHVTIGGVMFGRVVGSL